MSVRMRIKLQRAALKRASHYPASLPHQTPAPVLMLLLMVQDAETRGRERSIAELNMRALDVRC